MSLTGPSSVAPSWHDLTYGDLERALVSSAVPAIHAKPLWRALHRDAEPALAHRPDFPPPLRRWVDQVKESGQLSWTAPEVELETSSTDGLTQKFLLRFADGQTVETV